jgi:hypothetical protein
VARSGILPPRPKSGRFPNLNLKVIMTPTTEIAKTPGRTAAALFVTGPDGVALKAIKYPMPLKAPRFDLNVNGTTVSAAQTTFKLIKYTYFEFNGTSFYVPGHLDAANEYVFSYPEGYAFTPIKLDRKAQADAAAVARAAKLAAAPQDPNAAPVQAAAGDETGAEASGSSEVAEASTGAEVANNQGGKKGKKAHR